MKKNLLILLIFLSPIVLLSGCGVCKNMELSGITLIFVDKNTNEYIYLEGNPNENYNIDTLKILNEEGIDKINNKRIITNTPKYEIFLNIHEFDGDDQLAFKQEICKKYQIYFNKDEIEPIEICFKAESKRCGHRYKYLKVFYKNELVFEGYKNNNFDVTIKK